jgi:N-acylneuraminate cytidylyltransferase
MTTVAYVVNTNFVKKFDGIFEGMVKSVVVPPERAIDIDTMLDFKIAEYLILNR